MGSVWGNDIVQGRLTNEISVALGHDAADAIRTMILYLPDRRIPWKTIWIGAFITAFLFVLGKFLLGLYIGKSDPSFTYGAAGTVVLILLWVSYSALIFYGLCSFFA